MLITPDDIFVELSGEHPDLSGLRKSVMVMINHAYGKWDDALEDETSLPSFRLCLVVPVRGSFA